MNLGPAEILVILVLALVVFGPKRLPEVGRQLGGALRELRKVQHSVKTEIDTVLNTEAPATPARAGAIGAGDRAATEAGSGAEVEVEVELDADHDDAPPPYEAPPVDLDDPEPPPDTGLDGPSGSFV